MCHAVIQKMRKAVRRILVHELFLELLFDDQIAFDLAINQILQLLLLLELAAFGIHSRKKLSRFQLQLFIHFSCNFAHLIQLRRKQLILARLLQNLGPGLVNLKLQA